MSHLLTHFHDTVKPVVWHNRAPVVKRSDLEHARNDKRWILVHVKCLPVGIPEARRWQLLYTFLFGHAAILVTIVYISKYPGEIIKIDLFKCCTKTCKDGLLYLSLRRFIATTAVATMQWWHNLKSVFVLSVSSKSPKFQQQDQQLLRFACIVSSHQSGDSIAASVGNMFIVARAFGDAWWEINKCSPRTFIKNIPLFAKWDGLRHQLNPRDYEYG